MDSVGIQKLIKGDSEVAIKKLSDENVIEIKRFGERQMIGLTKEYREKNNIKTGK